MPKYENLPAEYEFVKPSPTLAQRAEKALRELGGFASAHQIAKQMGTYHTGFSAILAEVAIHVDEGWWLHDAPICPTCGEKR